MATACNTADTPAELVWLVNAFSQFDDVEYLQQNFPLLGEYAQNIMPQVMEHISGENLPMMIAELIQDSA